MTVKTYNILSEFCELSTKVTYIIVDIVKLVLILLHNNAELASHICENETGEV